LSTVHRPLIHSTSPLCPLYIAPLCTLHRPFIHSTSLESPRHNTAMTSIHHDNNFCLVTLHLPSSTSCHCPDHGPPRELDKKFDKIFNLKNTSNNNPTNILNNLCTGLETFLGFNKDSKGYTGQGIVYSDLDRLCDAVMGFLYQVLRDVSEKQPYSVGKNILINNILTLINKHLCSGHEGFKRLFTELPARIAGYNREVQEGNEKVKQPIKKLEGEMKELKTQVSAILNDNAVAGTTMILRTGDADVAKQAVDDVNRKLKDSIKATVGFTETTKTLQTEIADLNFDTRNNVNNAINAMKRELDVLQFSCQNQSHDLEYSIKKVVERCNDIHRKVDDETRTKVEALLNDIRNKMNAFQSTMKKDIYQPLSDWVKNNKEKLVASRSYVGDDILIFEDRYPKIHTALAEIKKVVQPLNDLMSIGIRMKNQPVLEGFAEDLNNAVEIFPKAIETDLDSLRIQITKLMNEYVTSLSDGEAYAGLCSEFINNVLESVIKTLDAKAAERGNTVLKKYGSMKINIEKFMENSKGDLQRIGQLVQGIKNDISNLKTQSTNTNVPDSTLTSITKTLPTNMRSLTTSINRILDVAEEVESKLDTWLQEVESYISAIDGLRSKCVSGLQSYINSAITDSKNIIITDLRKRYVRHTKLMLTAFADKVSQELQGLPGEIERDLRIGFKGLMRVMGGNKYTVKPDHSSYFDDNLPTELFNEISNLAQPLAPSPKGAQHLGKFKELSTAFHAYFTNIHKYTDYQIKSEIASEPQALQGINATNLQHLTAVNTKFNELLDHLKNDSTPSRTYIFDHTYTKKHESLSSSLHLLHPSHFANPRHPELLDAVRAGLQGFVEQMERVYVNGYDDGTLINFTLNPLVKNDA
ncbi:hypothetical protein, conserved, partial [Babesia bigemina]